MDAVSGRREGMTAADRIVADRIVADGAVAVAALLLAAGAGPVLAGVVLGQAGALALAPLFTALWLALYLWAAVRLSLAFGGAWIGWLARERSLLLVVLAAALLSTAWSIAPSLTLQRAPHLVGTTLLGIALGLVLPAPRLLALIGLVLAVLVVGGSALAVIAPDHGRQLYEGSVVWSGLQGDKNNFGLTAALAALFFATRPLFRGGASFLACLPLSALALVALAMSDSATALGALFAGATLIAVFLVPVLVRAPQLAGVLAALAALFLGAALVAGFGFGEAFGLFGRSTDLTGRAEIWRSVIALIGREPLTGTGYGALWFPRAGEEATQMAALGTFWTAYHAHNGLLQIASELGIPATLAAVALLVQLACEPIRLFWRTFSPFALLMIGVHAALIVNNVFEARWFLDRGLAWLLLITLSTAMRASQQACEAGAALDGAQAPPPHPPRPTGPS